MDDEFYDVPTQQGKPIENGVLFIPPCRTTLFGKEGTTQFLYQWNPNKNLYDSKEITDEKQHKQAGNIVWWHESVKDKKISSKHISFIGPVNRHFFFKKETVLQKKIFSCGKEIEPAPPQKVIGACKRQSTSLKLGFSPYIATRESDRSIGFYWLVTNPNSKKKEWVNKGILSFPINWVGYTVFFSQDGTKAVTYILEETEFKFGLAGMVTGAFFYIPKRVEITIDDSGNVGYTLTDTVTATVEGLPPDAYWNVKLTIEGTVASEFVDNELKHLTVKQELIMGVYQLQSSGGSNYIYFSYPELSVGCGVVSDVFDANGFHIQTGFGHLYHWSYYGHTSRPGPSESSHTVTCERYVGLAGRIAICEQTIQNFPMERTFNCPGLEAIQGITGEAPENLRTFWDFMNANWTTFDIGYFEDQYPMKNLQGGMTNKILSASFGGTFYIFARCYFLGNSSWVTDEGFTEPTYSVSTSRYSNSPEPAGNTGRQDVGKYRVVSRGEKFREIEMDVKGLNAGVTDHGILRKSDAKNERMTIAVCDLQSDVIILTGNNKLQIKKISDGTLIEEQNIQHLVHGSYLLSTGFCVVDGSLVKQRFIAFEGNVESYSNITKDGIWSSLTGLSYASDKFGNFILKVNDVKKLSNSIEQKNWSNLGVI